MSTFDGQLAPFAERFVAHFAVARGVIAQRGTLERSRQWHTNSRRGTLGKSFGGGFFGAYSLGSADTTEQITHTISLLQVGPNTLTDVQVPSAAYHQIATQGSKIGMVLSLDRRRMYFVANHSTGASAGQLPSWGLAGVLKVGGWIVAVLFGLIGLGSLGSVGGAAFIALAIASVAAARVGSIAVRRSREVFDQAVQLAITP